jgi:hypothetical protein
MESDMLAHRHSWPRMCVFHLRLLLYQQSACVVFVSRAAAVSKVPRLPSDSLKVTDAVVSLCELSERVYMECGSVVHFNVCRKLLM